MEVGTNSDHGIIVRQYEPRDRAEVRKIALDTADMGKPVDSYFSYPEPMADYLTRYYTDYELQSAWVAENAGEVVGYVTGSIFPGRHDAIMRLVIEPVAGIKAIVHGALFNRQTWRLLALAGTVLVSKNPFPRNIEKEYPAHLHINIKPGFRGGGVGRRLIETFLEHCRKSNIKGVHAGLRGDNESGRKFFEKMGFQLVFTSSPMVLYYIDGRKKGFELVTYARKT